MSGNAIYNFKLKITTLIYNNLLTKNQRNVLVQRAEPHPSQSPSIFAKVRYLLPVLAYFGTQGAKSMQFLLCAAAATLVEILRDLCHRSKPCRMLNIDCTTSASGCQFIGRRPFNARFTIPRAVSSINLPVALGINQRSSLIRPLMFQT